MLEMLSSHVVDLCDHVVEYNVLFDNESWVVNIELISVQPRLHKDLVLFSDLVDIAGRLMTFHGDLVSCRCRLDHIPCGY